MKSESTFNCLQYYKDWKNYIIIIMLYKKYLDYQPWGLLFVIFQTVYFIKFRFCFCLCADCFCFIWQWPQKSKVQFFKKERKVQNLYLKHWQVRGSSYWSHYPPSKYPWSVSVENNWKTNDLIQSSHFQHRKAEKWIYFIKAAEEVKDRRGIKPTILYLWLMLFLSIGMNMTLDLTVTLCCMICITSPWEAGTVAFIVL